MHYYASLYNTMYNSLLNVSYCSGDGTMRKNPQIWKKWNPEIGVNLHKYSIKPNLVKQKMRQ